MTSITLRISDLKGEIKKDRANKIKNEVITSNKNNAQIDWNWQEPEEKEDCSELYEVKSFLTFCTSKFKSKNAIRSYKTPFHP